MVGTRASAVESVYVATGEASPGAITHSLQALLRTRRHSIARHRFTVLDTFDGRVRRVRASLTMSELDGSIMVGWQPSGGSSLMARLDAPASFVWDLPQGPLQRALTPVIGVRRLLAQAEAEESGSLLEILDNQRKTVARVRIEAGKARLATSSSAWQQLPTIVTLTGMRGYEDAYERLVPVIESRPGLSVCAEKLQGAILRQVGVPQRGDRSTPRIDLAPTVRADVGAQQIHRALLSIIVDNEPGLRANLDTEFLHDFRVAVRRTRSLLRQIRHVFLPSAVEHFSTELSWLGRLTGPKRDMDVLVLGLREHRGEFPSDDIDALLGFFDQAQQKQHEELVEALDGARYRDLLLEWEAFLDRPVRSGPENRLACRPLAEAVSRRAWRLSQRLADSARTIDEHATARQLHDIRLDAKKLRYLIDVTPAFYDAADLEVLLGALKKLQRALGDFNDAYIQEMRLLEWGRTYALEGASASALLVLGRLAEQRRHRHERMRREVIDRLRRFGAKDTRSACRRAFKSAAGE